MEKEKQYISFDELTSQVSHEHFQKKVKFWDSKLNRLRLISFFILLGAILSASKKPEFNDPSFIYSEQTSIKQKVYFSHLDQLYYIELTSSPKEPLSDKGYILEKDGDAIKLKVKLDKPEIFSEETSVKIAHLMQNIHASNKPLTEDDINTHLKIFAE